MPADVAEHCSARHHPCAARLPGGVQRDAPLAVLCANAASCSGVPPDTPEQ